MQSREPLDFSPLAPKLQVSKAEDEDTREIENEEFRVLHKAEVDSFVKRKDTYRSNAGNAYALIFGQCWKAMQSKLQARTDFGSKIDSNPIELLNAIQEHSISYQERQYEMCVIIDAWANLVTLKQKEDESLLDYTGRFKSAVEIFRTQLG